MRTSYVVRKRKKINTREGRDNKKKIRKTKVIRRPRNGSKRKMKI